MSVRYQIKRSQYADSVSLMTIARAVLAIPGIEDAALVMGTGANKKLLEQISQLTPEAEQATASDLIIVLVGEESALDAAQARAAELLTSRPTPVTGQSSEYRPRTLREAYQSNPAINMTVISVAGAYAAAEARTALQNGSHVLLFSDNVSVEDEISLKDFALEKGLLMMGPGAGTAIINGAALGFANAVPRGPVGLISAAGTGLQEVSTLLARQGVGVSQAIGVGGRDLTNRVKGKMTTFALEALLADEETQVITIISKLPDPAPLQALLAQLSGSSKPAVICFMGARDFRSPAEHVVVTTTLHEAALTAAALARGKSPEQFESHTEGLKTQAGKMAAALMPGQRYLRGLFGGGTLCQEAMGIWQDHVNPLWSNTPFDPDFRLTDSHQSREHTALDMGEEEFTVGRLHPMIDYDLRLRRVLKEAEDPAVAAIQLDVVLGYGSHPDPASELAPVIAKAQAVAAEGGRTLYFIMSVTGTDDDPQQYTAQVAALKNAGAIVLDSNAEASTLAAFLANTLKSNS